jgi:hypothetical protein
VIALAGAVLVAGMTASPEAWDALEAMGTAASRTNDYTMRLVKRELIDGKLRPAESVELKWQRPQKVYVRRIDGAREGEQALYVQGSNKNRVKVRRWFNWNLDPYGTLAMEGVHHPLPEIGLVHLVDVVLDNVRRARAKDVGSLTLAGRETLFGRPALRVEATFPPTGKTPTLGKNQTLWDVAHATGQSMYVILHANEQRGWHRVDHPKAGDAVLVPDFYAGRFVLWIDEALHLPLQIDLYDHAGALYEHYEHHDLEINVGLGAKDFDPANPEYKF